MSTQQLVAQLLELPVSDRADVAQLLGASLGEGDASTAPLSEVQILEEARRRDAELTSGAIAGQSHEDVMAALRRKLECE